MKACKKCGGEMYRRPCGRWRCRPCHQADNRERDRQKRRERGVPERKRFDSESERMANRRLMESERRARIQSDPELRAKRNEYNREWRRKNPEVWQRYYEANSEAIKERSRRWREEHPERARATVRRCLEANPEAARRSWHNRRARKAGATGRIPSGIAKVLLRQQRGRCVACRVDLRKSGQHIDHIVPLARGGSNEASNLQLLCPACNQSKSDRDPIEFMQSKGFLL